jgi:beta-lactamase superfamily II metal-dependent hydrolase
MAHRFVALRDDGKKTYLYGQNRTTRVREVLWGDYLHVTDELNDGWIEIDWARKSPTKRQTLYIRREDTVDRRPLEIIFLDVGQGDGAVLISPERGANERIFVIDAGVGGNMRAFLNARFATYRGFNFHAAVLTHPDNDHYFGFLDIFSNHGIGFQTVYHNGLIERPLAGTWEKLGGKPQTDPGTGIAYLESLAVDRNAVDAAFANLPPDSRFQFARVMKAALDNPKIQDIRMLSTAHAQLEGGKAWMPGFGPSSGRGYTIEVLGPVVETNSQGVGALRKIGSYGETKNGHSVLLKLAYGTFSVLFGGDLNTPAEKFLLRHYTGRSRFPPEGTPGYDQMINDASPVFRCEVMKSCHHGSEKVTDAFLSVVNPAAFVISSGDAEGHVHPRPDLLGRLGRFGRGGAPVILSTELQRSTREREDRKAVDKLLADIDKLKDNATQPRLDEVKKDVEKLGRSNVDVYGAIYLKTDGQRLITAFRIESKSETKRWFSFRYTFNQAGELVRT